MARSTDIGFVELAAKSNYSFLQGASHPEELIERAAEQNYYGLALTDRDGVYGVPRAHFAAKFTSMKFITGAEITYGGHPLFLLAQNRNGYGNLCEILTDLHRQQTLNLEKANDLLALVPLRKDSEGLRGTSDFRTYFENLKDRFEDKLYLLASRHCDGRDPSDQTPLIEELSRRYRVDCVASNQPLYHHPHRKPLQDVLTCIRHRTNLANAGYHLEPNAERYLKTLEQLKTLFSDHPEWLGRTLEVAARCDFSLDEIRYHYPDEWIPKGETTDSFLARLTWEGARERYGNKVPLKVCRQIQKELDLIRELKYADYFLTTWDIVHFAKSQNILCQGRGSAANSVVCYALGITAIDPIRLELLVERFISRERNEPPDIDIDFEHERREEVIQYIYKRYGRHRAAITAEVICFRRKSALREVAKVFEIEEPVIKRLQKFSHRRNKEDVTLEKWIDLVPEVSPHILKLYFKLSEDIQSFPRHLGTHVGGFVLCQDALNRNVPIEDAAMPDRTIIQWDKNDLDALGFVRVDVLGLGMLTCLRKSFEILKDVYDIDLDLYTIPPEDPKVYEAMSRGDTVGVFQIESRAQMNMLPRLRPKTFFDLVVEISIVRPGPIQGGMIHPYLRRRNGQEPITYGHPALEKILKKTNGVPLFQEQILKMAMEIAGFTGGEADQLRRAMGSWRRDGMDRLTQLGRNFQHGLIERGIAHEFAEQIFNQIKGFAEYGFPESHAASFAILAYASSYIKFYYPDVLVTALLNSQPMGFYGIHTLISDAVRHGVQFRPVDVNKSHWDNRLEKPYLMRIGFREVRGLPKATGEMIVTLQKERPFESFFDFVDRLRKALPKTLNKRQLFYLASANAFDSLGLPRRNAFWEIQALPLRDCEMLTQEEESFAVPKESRWEKVAEDYESLGVSLGHHPMQFFREALNKKKVLRSVDLKDHARKRVEVAGVVISRQMPPSASGVLFITLEDEFGFSNLVVWNDVFQKHREVLNGHSLLHCRGRIEKADDGKVYHLIVDSAKPLMESHSPVNKIPSHDYH